MNPTNILILHAGALGDCALAVRFARLLRIRRPQASITMAARSPLARWARRRGLIDGAVHVDDIGVRHLHDPEGPLPESLTQFLGAFDCVISFLAEPTATVSLRLNELLGDRLMAIDPRPAESTIRGGRHIVDQWLDDFERGVDATRPGEIGTPSGVSFFSAEPLAEEGPCGRGSETNDGRLARRLGVSGGKILLCHPGSGGLEKCCPLAALERLMAAFRGEGWLPAWMVGPDEMERFDRTWMDRLRSTAAMVYEESIESAADLVTGADLYLGHDAGMTHVAALCGVPTVALFGPTDADVWRPLGNRVRVVGFAEDEEGAEAWITSVMSAAKDAALGFVRSRAL